jgi:copper chaperone CopZ
MATKTALSIALALLLPAAARAAEKTDIIVIIGWHSKGDALKTEVELRAIKGVARVTTDFDKKQVAVTYEDTQVQRPRLDKAITDAGYGVSR